MSTQLNAAGECCEVTDIARDYSWASGRIGEETGHAIMVDGDWRPTTEPGDDLTVSELLVAQLRIMYAYPAGGEQ